MKKLMMGAVAGLVMCGSGGALADDGGWIDRIDVERMVPPPPPRGSAIEKDEIAEIHRFQARATPAEKAQAKIDDAVEDPGIFNNVLGSKWNMGKLPKTAFLMTRIMYVDRPDSGSAKGYYHRARPWIVDPTIKTCNPHESGPALNAYPSGHAMLAYELGVVLAYLMPEKAQAILARAFQYSENRIVCGFHYRSDVTAGQQYGSILAVEMLHHPRFLGWVKDSRAELIAAGLTK